MFQSMIRVLKSVSLAAGLVVAFASTSSANQFQVTEVALVAQPVAHNGACPATISFVGRIKANGRGRVAYTFLRSDGARGPVFTVDFDEAGEKEVSTTWTIQCCRPRLRCRITDCRSISVHWGAVAPQFFRRLSHPETSRSRS